MWKNCFDRNRCSSNSGEDSWKVFSLFLTRSKPFAPEESTLTIEVTVTLRSLFNNVDLLEHQRGLSRAASISFLLQAFVTLQRPRCTRCHVMLRTGRVFFLVEDGDEQRRRNVAPKEGELIDRKRMSESIDMIQPRPLNHGA